MAGAMSSPATGRIGVGSSTKRRCYSGNSYNVVSGGRSRYLVGGHAELPTTQGVLELFWQCTSVRTPGGFNTAKWQRGTCAAKASYVTLPRTVHIDVVFGRLANVPHPVPPRPKDNYCKHNQSPPHGKVRTPDAGEREFASG